MPKSTLPIVKIHNIETDEIIEREMNDVEFAQYQLDEKMQIAISKEIESKAAEKAALLEKLGITADEAKLLLG